MTSLAELRGRAADLETRLNSVLHQIQAICPPLVAIRCAHNLYVNINQDAAVVATQAKFFFRLHWLDERRVCIEVPNVPAAACVRDEVFHDVVHRINQTLASQSVPIVEEDGPGTVGALPAEPNAVFDQLPSPFGGRAFLNVLEPVEAGFLGLGGRPYHMGVSALPRIFVLSRSSKQGDQPWSTPAAAEKAEAASKSESGPGQAPPLTEVTFLDTERNRYMGADKKFYGADINCDSSAIGAWEYFELVHARSKRPLPDSDALLMRALTIFATLRQ
jgi:hypothetical protein